MPRTRLGVTGGRFRDQPDGRPGRSFHLRKKHLFEQLDEEERKVGEAVARGDW